MFAQLEIWKASRCCGSETPRDMQQSNTSQQSESSSWNLSVDCNGIDEPSANGEFQFTVNQIGLSIAIQIQIIPNRENHDQYSNTKMKKKIKNEKNSGILLKLQ